MIDFNQHNSTMLPAKPFKLGTTSFIFPDHIVPNVKKLGRFFDEIELLVFESHPKEVLPTEDDIKELLNLSHEHNLTYNIHLPIDMSLSSESTIKRLKASDTILQVMELFASLTPSTFTLHLDMPQDIKNDIQSQKKMKHWQYNIRQSLDSILFRVANPEIISIETLDYPFSFVEFFIEEFSMSVCIDAGHQIKYGYSLLETFDKHRLRTPVIHLHGVDFSGQHIKDHTSLDKLPKQYVSQVQKMLCDYTGVVSLEVFNLENLNKSLIFLSKIFCKKI
ncbi:MAG: cobamide remodeling phosphodiesterase CbiR [Deltaproteobacteria bacterium]|jgi:sugar phosphate isomerase/epimerase|nr:cobamide remodeling phosphodiesterase CbiR [Deltaproteobacteria bacterium]